LTDALTQELFLIYQTALIKPKEQWPEAPRKPILSASARARLETLREKLNEIAQNLNIPARLIAPKADLVALAEGRQEGNRILTGWRHEAFGHRVADILK
jgi:ribonuclease D